jgi:hypothetical protein
MLVHLHILLMALKTLNPKSKLTVSLQLQSKLIVYSNPRQSSSKTLATDNHRDLAVEAAAEFANKRGKFLLEGRIIWCQLI